MSTLPLDQAIRANPTDFLGACVIWIPAAAWCVLLISWMVQGDMEVAPGLTFLGVVVTLMVFAANPPAPGMGGLFLLAMFALVLAFPVMYWADLKRLDKVAALGEFERAYDRLGSHPTDRVAILKLAAACRHHGMPGPAIRLAERALDGAPGGLFEHQRRMLEDWKSTALPVNAFAPTVCPSCDEENSPEAVFCAHCADRHYQLLAEGRIMPRSRSAQAVSWLAVGLVIVVLLPMVAASAWPVWIRITVSVVLGLAGMISLIRAVNKALPRRR